MRNPSTAAHPKSNTTPHHHWPTRAQIEARTAAIRDSWPAAERDRRARAAHSLQRRLIERTGQAVDSLRRIALDCSYELHEQALPPGLATTA
jgi:hypothetical protein